MNTSMTWPVSHLKLQVRRVAARISLLSALPLIVGKIWQQRVLYVYFHYVLFLASLSHLILLTLLGLHFRDSRSSSGPRRSTAEVVQASPSLPRRCQRTRHSRLWVFWLFSFFYGPKGSLSDSDSFLDLYIKLSLISSLPGFR
jgi:hypothetical protein